MTAQVISFINMKGGVGKTTLCKEIGFHLSHPLKKKVLLIDVDPQINLTQAVFKYYGFAQSEDIAEQIRIRQGDDESVTRSSGSAEISVSTKSISKIFTGVTSSPAQKNEVIQKLDPNLSIIPGELGIEFITRNLNSNKIENGLFDFIRRYDLREEYDYILIDCPPTYSSYTAGALKPSNFYVIPVRPEEYSLLGVDMLLQVVDNIVSDNDLYFENKPLTNLGVLFTDIPKTPSKWTTDFMNDMRSSEFFESRGVNFFTNVFVHNEFIKKDMAYFIDDKKSEVTSKPNLRLIVSEMLERISIYGK